jgi:hypothetical protein
MTATVLIEGEGAESEARELHARLGSEAGSEVDVQRAVDVVAVFTVVSGAVSAAEVIWSWWSARPRQELKARIAVPDGRVVDLDSATRDDVAAVLAALDDTAD